MILSEANKKLQDTNDHIQGMVDMPSLGQLHINIFIHCDNILTFQYNTFHTKVVTLHCHQGDLCKAPQQGKVLCQISFKTFCSVQRGADWRKSWR